MKIRTFFERSDNIFVHLNGFSESADIHKENLRIEQFCGLRLELSG